MNSVFNILILFSLINNSLSVEIQCPSGYKLYGQSIYTVNGKLSIIGFVPRNYIICIVCMTQEPNWDKVEVCQDQDILGAFDFTSSIVYADFFRSRSSLSVYRQELSCLSINNGYLSNTREFRNFVIVKKPYLCKEDLCGLVFDDSDPVQLKSSIKCLEIKPRILYPIALSSVQLTCPQSYKISGQFFVTTHMDNA